MASTNSREVVHPDPIGDMTADSVKEVVLSGTDTAATDDGRPGKRDDDNLLSGDRPANEKKSGGMSLESTDRAYV